MNIIYFNGHYKDKFTSSVNVEDRGYMFGDGVYEVVPVVKGFSIDFDHHLNRLVESLKSIELFTDYVQLVKTFRIVKDELLMRNGAMTAMLYLQVTRGIAARLHTFSDVCEPSILALLNKFAPPPFPVPGIECISAPDIRWNRRDIKCISLLGNVLLKQAAKKNSFDEVWLYNTDSRVVTECASRNCFIIDKDNNILTHPADSNILSGVTRCTLMRLARESGYNVLEKHFTIDEVYDANEAFTTTSGTFIVPVVRLDGRIIGSGDPGFVTRKLEYIYHEYVHGHVKYADLPKAVLFDWDNTIVNSQLQINSAARKTLVSMGMDPSDHVFYSGPRMQYFQKNFGDRWREAEKIFRKYLGDIMVQDLCLFPGIQDVLCFLKNNNVYTAVVSNKLSPSLSDEVNYFKLNNFFNKVVGSGDTLFDKPSPEPLLFALQGSGIEPSKSEVFFIGDSIVDMECAKNANVTGIVFNNHIPDYIDNKKIQDFNELLVYFKEMRS